MSVKELEINKNLYLYSSSRYHNINSSTFLKEGKALIIDTMLFPDDMKKVKRIVKLRASKGIEWVINTHYHLDHTCGNIVFNNINIMAHNLCRKLMEKHSEEILREWAKVEPEIADIKINLPNVTFSREAKLFFKDAEFELILTPGHSPDSICIYWKNKRILFAGDTVIPIPYFYYGNRKKLIETLKRIIELNPKLIVQGHCAPIYEENIKKELNLKIRYLERINEIVKESIKKGLSKREIYKIPISHCGIDKDPEPDDPFWKRDIHISNLARVYRDLKEAEE